MLEPDLASVRLALGWRALVRPALVVLACGGLVAIASAASAVADPGRDEVGLMAGIPVAPEREARARHRAWDDALLDSRDAVGYRGGSRRRISIVTLAGAEVEIATAHAFLEMRAAAAMNGVDLAIRSAFRTRAEQAQLYRAWRRGRGNRAARPGHSNHQSGRALDLSVQSPGTLAWLESNAAAFGFKRTVRGEPWHWEYMNVGRARGPRAAGRDRAAALRKVSKRKRHEAAARQTDRSSARKLKGATARKLDRPSARKLKLKKASARKLERSARKQKRRRGG